MRRRSVDAAEFRARCLGLLEEVHGKGIELIITKQGKPFAKVVLIDEPEKSESWFGRQKGSMEICGDIVSPIRVEWDATK